MSLKQTIETEYKNALKSKEKTKISTYRLILSSIKDLDIVNRSGPNKKETDDEDIKKLLKKMVKQRAESIDIYKKNNRSDLLEVEQNEYDILTGFLPKQLGEEETKKICAEVISKLGASSVKDMGKVMGELKKLHADEIDFAKAGLNKIKFYEKMKQQGILLQVHYLPVHLQPYYRKQFGYKKGDLPNAEEYFFSC